MKIQKIIGLIFLFFCFLSGYCQYKPSRVLFVQGLVNPLSSLKTKNDFTLEADMRVGCLLKNNLAMGLNLETYLWKSKDDYFMQTIYIASTIKLKGELSMYSAGPFIRYYFSRGKFVLFPEVSLGGAYLDWEYNGNKILSGQEKYVFIKYGLGANYFLFEKLAFEVLLSYRRNDIGYIPLSYYYPKEKIAATIGLSLFFP